MTADLHTRLLAELHAERYDSPTEMRLAATLGVVVEHHAPVQRSFESVPGFPRQPSYLWCPTCRAKAPCPEIRLIADQLGLTEGTADRER